MSEAPTGSARPLRLTRAPPVASIRNSLMTTTHDRRDPTAANGDSPVDAESAAPPPDEHPTGAPRRMARRLNLIWSDPGRRRVTIGWALLAASLVVYFFVAGVPWSLNWVFVYVAAGLVVSSLGSGVKWRRLIKDWLPFFLVLTVYGLLRSYASHTLWGPFVRPQVWIDTHIFGLGVDPTVQLQRWLYSPGLHVWDYLCWCCYMSHFFVSFIVAAVLWKTNYAKFRRFVPLFVALTFLGYVTYVLFRPCRRGWPVAVITSRTRFASFPWSSTTCTWRREQPSSRAVTSSTTTWPPCPPSMPPIPC